MYPGRGRYKKMINETLSRLQENDFQRVRGRREWGVAFSRSPIFQAGAYAGPKPGGRVENPDAVRLVFAIVARFS
jgi:hypothetical protein